MEMQVRDSTTTAKEEFTSHSADELVLSLRAKPLKTDCCRVHCSQADELVSSSGAKLFKTERS
jgi:hypothetical protein